jgi:predicted nucleic acid-binding protein
MSEDVLVALDTNILAYADRLNDARRAFLAIRMIGAFKVWQIILPTQVLGEFYNIQVRKFGVDAQEARRRVLAWSARFELRAATSELFAEAFDLAASRQLQIWDALVLATAAHAGCKLLLSEDLQDGFVWKGCTVANPFADPLHPLLADALSR